ncbi:glutathione hydrolase 1 proenzyme-like [Oscarella lobularis]|uniref:glutathione hydrolase 1 proenzyme-like n=1 Tax=Oscarella lobularis TaxID=121494 RepID=UPI003313FC3E
MSKNKKIGIVVVVVIGILAIAAVFIGLWLGGVFSKSSSQTQKYDQAAVASASETCSDIGKNILKDKMGNAVDAAVAVAFCLGVVEFQSSGLGGGGFALFYNAQAQGKIYSVDFRSTAPQRTDKFMLNSVKEHDEPGKFVATPGELSGLHTLWTNYGSKRVDWADLLQPSIDLAENGFKVSTDLAKAVEELHVSSMNMMNDEEDSYLDDPKFSSLLALVKPDGKWIKEGQKLVRPILAETLKNITKSSETAISTLYNKPELAQEVEMVKGIIESSDFESYRTTSGTRQIPLENGGTLYGPDLPSSAVIQFFIKNVLQKYSMTSADAETLLFYHRLVESFKFAFGRRNALADPASEFGYQQSLSVIADSLSDASYAGDIQAMIGDESVQNRKENYYNEKRLSDWTEYVFSDKDESEKGGTTHLSVIDADGNAVSLTTSVGFKFGCKIVSPSTGIVYNNDMIGFSYSNPDENFALPTNERNWPEAGKRPMSSMSPVIAVDSNDEVSLVIGGAGGPRIITSVALAISQHLLLGQRLDSAVNSPRIHHQLSPYAIYTEKTFDSSITNQLGEYEKKVYGKTFVRHDLLSNNPFKASAVHAIARDKSTGKLTAVCDTRLSGKPSGY